MIAVRMDSRSAWSRRVSAAGLHELSPDGTLVAVNKAYCELLGRSQKDLLGHSPVEFTHHADADASSEALSQAHRMPGVDSQVEKRYLRGDGQVRWARVTEVWRPDLQRVLGHIVDITDTVRARQAARIETRRAQALIAYCADLIFTVDAHGRFADSNPAARTLVDGKVGAPAIGVIADFVHPDDAPRVTEALTTASRQAGPSAPVLFRLRGPDGSFVHLSAIVDNQFADPDLAAMIITAHDVTAEVEQLRQLTGHQQSLVAALGRAAEFRDPYTAGHQLAVAGIASAIAVELGLAADDIAAIALGASIHDIGKIALPAEILTRPGSLSAAEYEIIKTHCRVGRDILGNTNLPPQVADVVLHHHERFDGSGYPDHLAGEQISLAARIVAVADVLDAMVSHRPYRPALGLTAARAEIRTGSGSRYDPDVAAAALRVIPADRRNQVPDVIRPRRSETRAAAR